MEEDRRREAVRGEEEQIWRGRGWGGGSEGDQGRGGVLPLNPVVLLTMI